MSDKTKKSTMEIKSEESSNVNRSEAVFHRGEAFQEDVNRRIGFANSRLAESLPNGIIWVQDA